MYQNLTIYYFSGTGNARNVAHWFAEAAKNAEISVDMVNIGNTNGKNIPKPPVNSLIGFISPTHGFNIPPIMLNFMGRFPKSANILRNSYK